MNRDPWLEMNANEKKMKFFYIEALAVEAPRFGKGSGAKEDPLQPANLLTLYVRIIYIVKNSFLSS